MLKNEIKKVNISLSSHANSQNLNEIITKNTDNFTNVNRTIHKIIPQKKSVSATRILDKIGDIAKYNERKKRNRGKIPILRNEKMKKPRGKRTITNNEELKAKLNLNNLNKFCKSLTPKSRTDKNGVEINKENKKKIHITFLDEIYPNKIIDTINIQSFKGFNFVTKFSNKSKKKIKIPFCSQCCSIF